MFIESLAIRPGGTTISLDATEIHFRPGVYPDDPTLHAAEVMDEDHQETLLALTEGFAKLPTPKLGVTVGETGVARTLTGAAAPETVVVTMDDHVKAVVAAIADDSIDQELFTMVHDAVAEKMIADGPEIAENLLGQDDDNQTTTPDADDDNDGNQQLTDDDKAPADPDAKPDWAGMDDQALRDAYAEKEGRQPPDNIKRETLIAKLSA